MIEMNLMEKIVRLFEIVDKKYTLLSVYFFVGVITM
jgi:hypothetical protein